MSVLRTSQLASDILVINIQNNDKHKTYAMCLFFQFFPGRSYIMFVYYSFNGKIDSLCIYYDVITIRQYINIILMRKH